MVFYTNKFVDEGKAGKAILCFIFIKPDYKNDLGILIHEKVHVKQFWRKPFTHSHKLLNQDYMLDCEVEAYAAQIKYYVSQGANKQSLINEFANAILTGYGLSGYTLTYIIDRLTKALAT